MIQDLSDDEIEPVQRFLLKFAGALAEIGDGDTLRDLHYCVADFLHHGADRAAGFVGTRALFVKPFADTTHWRQRAFDVPDHRCERNLFWPARQAVTARHAA